MPSSIKIVRDWFVTIKMIKRLLAAVYAAENILYFNKDSSNVVFNCNGMGILNIDLNNINLDDTNYDEDDPDTIILIILLASHTKFEKGIGKEKVSEELMSIALISCIPIDGRIGAYQKMRKNI